MGKLPVTLKGLLKIYNTPAVYLYNSDKRLLIADKQVILWRHSLWQPQNFLVITQFFDKQNM